MEEDVEFFTYAEPADLGDGVERCSSLDNPPFDVVGDSVPLELSDMSTEGGSLHILPQSVDVSVVLVNPLL